MTEVQGNKIIKFYKNEKKKKKKKNPVKMAFTKMLITKLLNDESHKEMMKQKCSGVQDQRNKNS